MKDLLRQPIPLLEFEAGFLREQRGNLEIRWMKEAVSGVARKLDECPSLGGLSRFETSCGTWSSFSESDSIFFQLAEDLRILKAWMRRRSNLNSNRLSHSQFLRS